MMTLATAARTCCDASEESSRKQPINCERTASAGSFAAKPADLNEAAIRTSASPSCSNEMKVGTISVRTKSSPNGSTSSQKCSATT